MPRRRAWQYPYRKVGQRKLLSNEERLSLAQTESSAGIGRPRAQVPRAFLRRQRTVSTVGSGLLRFRPPAWARRLTAARRPRQEMLDALEKRVYRAPAEKNLRQALIILNDIGRLRGGGKLLRERLTQQVVDRLIGGGM